LIKPAGHLARSAARPIARPATRAFTLLEVLLALALTLLLGAGVSAFAWNIIDTRSRVLAACAQQHAASSVFAAVERTLTGATLAAPGIRAEAASLRVSTRLADAAVGTDDPVIEPRVFELRFDSATGSATLALAPVNTRAEPSVLADRFERVRIRCHDGRTWVDTFDAAEAGRLPVAVEVAIWYAPAPARRPPPITASPRPTAPQPSRRPAEPTIDPFGDEPLGSQAAQRAPDRVRIFAILDPDAPAPFGSAGLASAGSSR